MFSSCSSLYDYNESEIEKARDYWIGRSEQSLLTSWGPPNTKSSDGRDGEIYQYKRNNGYIIWVTNFYINRGNFIYHLNAFSE